MKALSRKSQLKDELNKKKFYHKSSHFFEITYLPIVFVTRTWTRDSKTVTKYTYRAHRMHMEEFNWKSCFTHTNLDFLETHGKEHEAGYTCNKRWSKFFV